MGRWIDGCVGGWINGWIHGQVDHAVYAGPRLTLRKLSNSKRNVDQGLPARNAQTILGRRFFADAVKSHVTPSHTLTPFDRSGKEAFWKHSGKRRNGLYKQFLLYLQCFLLYLRQKLSFLLHLICRQQMLSIWTDVKFCRVLTHSHTMTPFDASGKQAF